MGSSPSPPPPMGTLITHHSHKGRSSTEFLRRVGCFLLGLFIGATTSIFFLFNFYHADPFTIPASVVESLHGNTTSTIQNYQGGDDQEERKCDLLSGRWVRDVMRGPAAYTNVSCPTLPESKDCIKYGKDMEYLNWRWKPYECEIPRFEPNEFLNIVRGKKMAFIGDSVARNQMESLLCLLSQIETPISIYKDAEDRFRTWYFPSHDFTLTAMWTRFLVVATERIDRINETSTSSGVFDIHLDRVDPNWGKKLPGIHHAIISGGHWFFRKSYLYENGNLIGCVFCSGEPNNLTELGIKFAIQRTFRTSLQFINSNCEECEDGILTLVRTFSPAHFENGSWNSGGNCNKTRPIVLEGDHLDYWSGGSPWELRKVQVEEIGRLMRGSESVVESGVNWRRRRRRRWFDVLDVTKAMLMRPDGHPNSHWNNEWMRGYNDCLHWCLPGPIELWNDLLQMKLKKSL